MNAKSPFHGLLPQSWRSLTLGEVCKLGGGNIQTGPFGSQLHAADYVTEGIPSVMPQNIGDNRILEEGIARITLEDAERLNRYLLRTGDVVYSRRGDVERRALVRTYEDGWLCGTGCLRVRFGNGFVDPDFGAFYLGDPNVRAWIVGHAVGATMPNLNTGILSSLPFVLPPLEIQQKIASILGALDDKIELNRRTNATLEIIAQTLFKSWFVDFDPVKAKAAGLEPEGLDATTAALFPSGFESSNLGEIPEGWEFVELSKICEINPTRRLPKAGLAPYLDMGNMPTKGSRALDWYDREIGSGAKFINGDTLFARITPCLENGKTAFVDFLEPEQVGWGSTEYIVRPKPPFPLEYAYILARDEAFRKHAIQSMTGSSGRQRASAEAMGRYIVVVPSTEILEHYSNLLNNIFKSIKSRDEESRALTITRDSLLPKLLSGELDVSDFDLLEANSSLV
jgi:type I restriction enzyme, S subunit